MSDDPHTANPGYAVGQQLRAMRALAEHPDPEVRRRAEAKVQAWQEAIAGMAEGRIQVGSRTPVRDTPAWATLEVLHGGFASGRLSAEQPLDGAEQALLATLSPPEEGETDRGRLNRYALSVEGQSWLVDQLKNGTYRVELPEHGALAVVAWLHAHGDAAGAMWVVEAIAPFFDRLRFTPRPAEQPLTAGMSVTRVPAGEVAAELRAKAPQRQVARMNETLRVWNPLYDRAVALFLETLEDGQPMRRRPEGWTQAARALLRDVDEARQRHTLCAKPHAPRSYFARLIQLLRAALSEGGLSEGQVRRLRHVLEAFLTRHGAPGSERLRRVREEQARIAALPSLVELARLLAQRLEPFGEAGLPNLELALRAVTEGESEGVPAGWALPEALREKAARCLEAPVEELVELGVIPSGEVLAEVLPQITSQVAAAGIDDPVLRRLYSAIYGAFRRRRSLLLLNLESQVKLEELPWVAALSGHRRQDMGTKQANRQALEQLCALNFTAFPQTILPNPLIQEIAALARGAGLELPLVEEIAADIFMGSFTPKFERAALTASALLQGSLYARYYDLPEPSAFTGGSASKRAKRWGREVSAGFAELCAERAKEAHYTPGQWTVANNGVIIEQSQILHTHNLAVLFNALELRAALAPRLPELAWACFTWILRRNAMKVDDWRAQLQLIKNSAYAWRQMLFYLSMAGEDAARPFVERARAGFLDAAEAPGVKRYEPALIGLEGVIAGGRFDRRGRLDGGRRLLGWTVQRHWLFDA